MTYGILTMAMQEHEPLTSKTDLLQLSVGSWSDGKLTAACVCVFVSWRLLWLLHTPTLCVQESVTPAERFRIWSTQQQLNSGILATVEALLSTCTDHYSVGAVVKSGCSKIVRGRSQFGLKMLIRTTIPESLACLWSHTHTQMWRCSRSHSWLTRNSRLHFLS